MSGPATSKVPYGGHYHPVRERHDVADPYPDRPLLASAVRVVREDTR